MSLNVTLGDKLLFPSEYLGAVDLKGKDFVLTIAKVEVAELRMQGGASKSKPIVYFDKAKKKFVLNKTNAAIIAGLYGGKVEDWTGRKVVLYPTTTRCGANTVECIRIRDYNPDQPPPAPESGNEGGGDNLGF